MIKLLIIDQSILILKKLEELLHDYNPNLQIATANSFEEAKEIYNQYKYPVVLLDMDIATTAH